LDINLLNKKIPLLGGIFFVMKLNLKKPIAFFDLETTGISITHDRIVEIAKMLSNANPTEAALAHAKNLVNLKD